MIPPMEIITRWRASSDLESLSEAVPVAAAGVAVKVRPPDSFGTAIDSQRALHEHATNGMTTILNDVGECVDAVLRRLGSRIVLALPLGIGKPNPIANEFYRRAVRDPSIHLTIFTALSLRKPAARSDLERRFLERSWSGCSATTSSSDYVRAMRADSVPPNIRIVEFFLEPGRVSRPPGMRSRTTSARTTPTSRAR